MKISGKGIDFGRVPTHLVQVIVDHVILLGLVANVLAGGHTIQVDLMENCSLRTHPRVFGPADAVVEGLTLDTIVGVISVLSACAQKLGVQHQQSQFVRLVLLSLSLFCGILFVSALGGILAVGPRLLLLIVVVVVV